MNEESDLKWALLNKRCLKRGKWSDNAIEVDELSARFKIGVVENYYKNGSIIPSLFLNRIT